MDDDQMYDDGELDSETLLSLNVQEDLMEFMRSTSICLDVIQLLNQEDSTAHYSIVASMCDLIQFKPKLAIDIFDIYATTLMKELDKTLQNIQKHLISENKKENGKEVMIYKPFCHFRFHDIANVQEYVKANVSSIRACDVGTFLKVIGTVTRTGTVKMLEAQKEFICTNSRCKHQFTVNAQVDNMYILALPKKCPSKKSCKCTVFKELSDSKICKDFQEIVIQEQVQKLTVGMIPRSIVVILENDLADTVKAGDDIAVTGQLIRRWRNVVKGVKIDIEIALHANYCHIYNGSKVRQLTEDQLNEFRAFWEYYKESPLTGRNVIIKSVCPQLYGVFLVKLAVLMTLVGGVGSIDNTGTRTRSESHLLLIGDPGTGKSQILRYAAKLSPRSVLTTGIGTTSAGLTCSAVKDSGEWMLEAGALVLADRGLCCIDEFSDIREHDRATIHEAMEQQTLSVAKAGLVCKLNTRTTIFAAANPRGKYDTSADVSVNTNIATPLLSRFDLVLVLLDQLDLKWDRVVSDFILKNVCVPNEKHLLENEDQVREADSSFHIEWTLEKLQDYIAYIKSEFQPKLEPEAQEVLSKYYQNQRGGDSRSAARTTIRLLESLIRLSQAHARIMFRDKVILQDAIVSVAMIESSISTSSSLGVESIFHSDFSLFPDQDYVKAEYKILHKLNLLHLIPPTLDRENCNQNNYLRDGGSGDENNNTGLGAFLKRTRVNNENNGYFLNNASFMYEERRNGYDFDGGESVSKRARFS